MSENKWEANQKRDARGEVINLLNAIPEEKQKELIDRYKMKEDDSGQNELGVYRHRIIVGTWFNRTVKTMISGGTKEEVYKMLYVLFVAINMKKHNLDLTQAIDDADLGRIMEKYIHPRPVERQFENTPEGRRRMVEMAEKRREILETNMQKLHKEGFTNREIGMILKIPESSVVTYLSKKVWED